ASPTGPDAGPPVVEQITDLPVVAGEGYRFELFTGELAGRRSPARVFTPLVGADGVIEPGATVRLPVEPGWEHGVLVFDGEITLAEDVAEYFPDRSPSGREAAAHQTARAAGETDVPERRGRIRPGHLVYFGGDREHVEFTAGDEGARVVLIGGAPFDEP